MITAKHIKRSIRAQILKAREVIRELQMPESDHGKNWLGFNRKKEEKVVKSIQMLTSFYNHLSVSLF